MDFYVHDNIENYNNRFPFNGMDKTRLNVEQIYIPVTGAFWFRTNYNIIETNVNLNKKYLHLHAGLTQFERMQFDIEPHMVKRTELFYNPKEKCVEITIPKSFFRHKTIFKKQCIYRGTELPDRKISIIGNIFYDMPNQQMHFILNYFPQGKRPKFHWEEEEEPPTMEQLMREQELEEKVAELENKLSSRIPNLIK